jgi:hypothetical protein
MTGIQLVKFIHQNKVEWKWFDNDVIMFVDFADLSDFQEMLGYGIVSEAGIDCTMKEDCIVFEMKDICNYFGIELAEVFDKQDDKQ